MAKIAIKKARSLLKEETTRMTDKDIQKLLEELDVLANICIDAYLEEKRKDKSLSKKEKQV